MSRNIKEIGKELMGKSLNSFHRKTGLTQLEKNNEMQDGILDGILSQVDDAYIEKTEQSNVIHLDGSGDGVVVLDSIEGNTMVNLATMDNWREGKSSDTHRKVTITSPASWKKVYKFFHLKPNTTYTIFIKITNNSDATTGKMYMRLTHDIHSTTSGGAIGNGQSGVFSRLITLDNTGLLCLTCESGVMTGDVIFENLLLLEGDWTNKEMPTYFEGLQSSFEEKVNDEGKYEIEILSKNKNLLGNNNKDLENWIDGTYLSKKILLKPNTTYTTYAKKKKTPTSHCVLNISRIPYTGDNASNSPRLYTEIFNIKGEGVETERTRVFTTDNTGVCYLQYFENGHRKYNNNIDLSQWFDEICDVTISEGNNTLLKHIEPKQNKIKLLLDEPLRSVGNIKDRFVFKDGKLMIERNIIQKYYNGTQGEFKNGWTANNDLLAVDLLDLRNKTTKDFVQNIICDSFITTNNSNVEGCYKYYNNESLLSIPVVIINKNKLETPDIEGFKVWLRNNPINLACVLEQPIYEEVLNEYGEPILLEGYENGTIYIDSTIVPTTTVRYTPKMESLKTLKEVENNNIMLTNDVNDNIIPYMMDVDLMIMEKEMALMSHKNIRTIGVKDMTSMQKRTQDMLTRLIKGKTLTEQECKTRVTTYLNAGKITDTQAEELMLLISEVYA